MSQPEELKKIVNASGFPLQVGVEHAVNSSRRQYGYRWEFLTREHAWKNEASGTNGFIDLVLENENQVSIMIVECKRVRDSSWIFLLPGSENKPRHHIKCWITRIKNQTACYFDWADIVGEPTTFESGFCVVAGQDAKSKPMLERVASDIVEATEGFASEEYSFLKAGKDELRIYFNVVVTTAKLSVCSFEPHKVSLETGILEEASFQEVPFIRFRKQLSVHREISEEYRTHGYRGVIRAKENTVFIVNTTHLLMFLQKFQPHEDSVMRVVKE